MLPLRLGVLRSGRLAPGPLRLRALPALRLHAPRDRGSLRGGLCLLSGLQLRRGRRLRPLWQEEVRPCVLRALHRLLPREARQELRGLDARPDHRRHRHVPALLLLRVLDGLRALEPQGLLERPPLVHVRTHVHPQLLRGHRLGHRGRAPRQQVRLPGRSSRLAAPLRRRPGPLRPRHPQPPPRRRAHHLPLGRELRPGPGLQQRRAAAGSPVQPLPGPAPGPGRAAAAPLRPRRGLLRRLDVCLCLQLDTRARER
mmetsp:Transcript_21004/g.59418  ORF Transcript_21004/g.59418 Transcript_21004/m.59418 type:complete len:256 (+) Transcript_21004:276-1043(+)